MATMRLLATLTVIWLWNGRGEVWRNAVKPYLMRYGYGRGQHRPSVVKRNFRYTVGNFEVVRDKHSVGYWARASHFANHAA